MSSCARAGRAETIPRTIAHTRPTMVRALKQAPMALILPGESGAAPVPCAFTRERGRDAACGCTARFELVVERLPGRAPGGSRQAARVYTYRVSRSGGVSHYLRTPPTSFSSRWTTSGKLPVQAERVTL